MFHATSIALLACVLYGIAAATTTLTTVNAQDIVAGTNQTTQEICSLLPLGKTILLPNSCTHWVSCPATAGGSDYDEGACVFGLYYNKDNEKCEPLTRVNCPYSETQNTNRCAQQKDGTFLADETDCSHYIYCSGGGELRSACPGDLVFNAERGACVYRTDYNCPKPSEQRIADPICRSVPNDISFAHEHECAKYHMCQAGVLSTFECDYDKAFDHLSGKCVPTAEVKCLAGAKMPEPENTICGTKEDPRVGYFSDQQSCSGYFLCGEPHDGTPDRHPYHLRCDNGYFFDSKRLSCRDRVNVKCTFDRCEGMGNKYVNIAGDCAAYAYCKDGVVERTGTCAANYYFDERSQGCTSQNINYAACSA